MIFHARPPSSAHHLMPLSRDEVAKKLLGQFSGKTVLVVGIGGGGDVVGTLPTCFDLERQGATAIPAGLTWKRIVHDPRGRPRQISEFKNATVFNDLIAEVGPNTITNDKIAHVEARVSSALGGRPVVMLDITPGSAALSDRLADYCERRSIDAVIGLDAGGDVLCEGSEPTLESPICDQLLVAALSELPDTLLGVFGFGSDGEMPLEYIRPRFAGLRQMDAYLGALPIESADIPLMQQVLESAPTEASRLPISIAQGLSPDRLQEILRLLNSSEPNLNAAIGEESLQSMRSGHRTAHLSDLSATTMFFKMLPVFRSSQFGKLWDATADIDGIAVILKAAGITTEFTEAERTAILAQSKT